MPAGMATLAPILKDAEMALYFCIVMWPMFQNIPYMAALSEAQLGNDEFRALLSPGWLWGRLQDLRDLQWRTMRGNFPTLVGIMSVFVGGSTLVKALSSPSRRAQALLWYYCAMGSAFAAYLHGGGTVVIALLLGLNFFLTRLLGRTRAMPAAVWGIGRASRRERG
eukprot:RCo039648